MLNLINQEGRNASKRMCFLVTQRKKTCTSVQDLEYAENYWKYVEK